MPAFVAFTQGPETNPRLLADTETAPLLVGRFRAVAPRPSASSSSLASVAAAAAAAAAPAPAPLPHRPQSPPPAAGGCRESTAAVVAWAGYGTVVTAAAEEATAEADEDEEDEAEEDDGEADDPSDDEPSDDEQTDPLLDGPHPERPDRAPRPAAPAYRLLRRRTARGLRRTAQRARRHLRDLWLTPTRAAVRRAVARWWTRWALLVVLPAAVAVAWCAVPFPQCPLGGGDGEDDDQEEATRTRTRTLTLTKPPGHGEARVRIRFWFFLLAYYGPYNVTALLWITKVFNLYSLNWWPPALGFPLSVSLLAALSLAVPAAAMVVARAVVAAAADPGYLRPAPALVLAARGLLALARRNTAWVTWTFAVMAMPVAAALAQLLRHERHLPPRRPRRPGGGGGGGGLAAAAAALWLGEADDDALVPRRPWRRRRRALWRWRWPLWCLRVRSVCAGAVILRDTPDSGRGIDPLALDPAQDDVYYAAAPDDSTTTTITAHRPRRPRPPLPASFVRFLWLMAALFTSLLVYVLGEASASLFVAALPAMRHATAWAVAYVYGWTVVVFLLDALTGWILGGHQGERVGSYPLGWVFKLYFMLTYQTYVRALYVRLRSPAQFVYLQVLSSTTLVVVSPLLMSPWTHRLLAALRLNGQPYAVFQKVCVRNVFVRLVAQNASMLAFLGSLLVLHFGPNRSVYPYLAFGDADYTFAFTLYASSITWACELVAAAVVAALIRYFYGLRVVAEGQRDLAAWPELLPTSVAVAVHVLQNMLFSIIRLRFC